MAKKKNQNGNPIDATANPEIRTITHFSSSSRVDQVVIVQALPQTENPTIESIKPEFLANIAAKMSLFDIMTNDIILMGTKGYFSYKENDQAWKVLQRALKHRQDFLGITR